MFLRNAKYTLAIPVLRLLAKTHAYRLFGERSLVHRLADIQVLDDIKHEAIHPIATYAPWRTDEAFLYIYDIVRDHTLVDLYRCYELWSLGIETAKTCGGDILEVGVWRGGTGAILASSCVHAGSASTVYLADTFEGVVKAGDRDTNYAGGEHSDTSEGIVAELCRRKGFVNVTILKGIFPDDTGHRIADRTFRLCHIDVDTFDSARGVFEWVWPRMIAGGAVIFDDFGFYNCTGVTRLVEGLRSERSARFVHNLNGHAILFKT